MLSECKHETIELFGSVDSTFSSLSRTCQLEVILYFVLRLGVVLDRLKVDDQRVFDTEDDVVIDILALSIIDLCNDRPVSRRRHLCRNTH